MALDQRAFAGVWPQARELGPGDRFSPVLPRFLQACAIGMAEPVRCDSHGKAPPSAHSLTELPGHAVPAGERSRLLCLAGALPRDWSPRTLPTLPV